MISEYFKSLNTRVSERSDEELNNIFECLKVFRFFQSFEPSVIRELCKNVYVEFLDKDVYLFKQGDLAFNWYGVICGSLDIKITQTGRIQDSVTMCTLGAGTEFGDSVLDNKPHSVSVVSNKPSTLLRIISEDFKELWKHRSSLKSNKLDYPISELEYILPSSIKKSNNVCKIDESNQVLNLKKKNFFDNHNSTILEQYSQSLPLTIESRKSFCCLTQNCEKKIIKAARHGSEGHIKNINSFNKLISGKLKSNQIKENLSCDVSKSFLFSIEKKEDLLSLNLKNLFFKKNPFNNYDEFATISTLVRIAQVLKTYILHNAPHLIITRYVDNFNSENNDISKNTFTKKIINTSMVGSELVDYFLSITTDTSVKLLSRFQAISMWQVLFEESIIVVVPGQFTLDSKKVDSFEDKFIFYKFFFDCTEEELQNQNVFKNFFNYSSSIKDCVKIEEVENEIFSYLVLLNKLGSSAMFRKILRKEPEQRTVDEIDLVYLRLMNIKSLSPLSNSIRQELAQVVKYESHKREGSIVFNQGEVGTCWYIVLKGSVNVIILGKGIVCTLKEGDDFGKLALVNKTARAATIVTNEDDCQLLKVSTVHYEKIMKDAEANTVRLKEHGNEVLILQKMLTKLEDNYETILDDEKKLRTSFKYMVMAGTPEKIVEYLLETRIDVYQDPVNILNNCSMDRSRKLLMNNANLLYNVFDSTLTASDTFLEDFLLTYQIYLNNSTLIKFLLKYYSIDLNLNNTVFKLSCGAAKTKSTALTYEKNSNIINSNQADFFIMHKRKVIRFLITWLQVAKESFFMDDNIINFLKKLDRLLEIDLQIYPSKLNEEVVILNHILDCKKLFDEKIEKRGVKKWKSDSTSNIRKMSMNNFTSNFTSTSLFKTKQFVRINSLISRNVFKINRHSLSILSNTADISDDLNLELINDKNSSSLLKHCNVILAKDEIISRIYCADHTYTTIKLPVDSTAYTIKIQAASKLGLLIESKNELNEKILQNQKAINFSNELETEKKTMNDLKTKKRLSIKEDSGNEFVLVEVKSNGERIPFKDTEVSIQTSTSVNGRIFLTPIDHLEALTPLPEQAGPNFSSFTLLENFTSLQLAYYLTSFGYSLFENVHEYELVYQVFGRHNFSNITSNLDVFLKHFNEIQYWVVTEICLQNNLSKRVHLLKKFIILASICKEYKNLNTFFAIVMGISNVAVTRLTQTWDKLPNKLKSLFNQFEALIDPSRNHRKYRIFLSKLSPPIIPFTPLLLKDMTFAHEGNLTFIDKGMINFEKMHMVAQTLRVIKFCKSKPLNLDNFEIKDVKNTDFTSSIQFKNALKKIDLYLRDLKIIDNQKTLNQLSNNIERRK